tara:strand:- start:64 stop:1008 length:945 start_codon:yes stop_codon:yes gene_type:complete
MWAKLGMRASFGLGAAELGKSIEDLMILTGDVSTSAGLDRFKKKFPEKYLDVGIAEQNLIGIAAGLSSEGYKVITTTFAPFQTMRCCEHIKVNLGYMKQKVSMVGLASGLVLGPLGYTHCCIEDIGVLRSIPNLSIISPADSAEAIKAIEASLNYNNSTYIRLSGGSNLKQIYYDDYNFQIGKAITLKKGGKISIIATGTMVGVALECFDILAKKNIKVEVVNMHTIKPLDKNKLEEVSKNAKLIITLEEHNIIGGLGSAVSEVISELDNRPKVIKFGIDDRYTEGGEYSFLKEKFFLSPQSISENIIKELKIK